jgi:mono/diheme cytochrome c family protein
VRALLKSSIVLAAALGGALASTPAPSQTVRDAQTAKPRLANAGDAAALERSGPAFLAQHCAECHSGPDADGDFELARATLDSLETWRAIRRELAAGRMPPRKAPQPSATERAALLEQIRAHLAARATPIDPGAVTLRRLNRSEYRNSVRDLCGVEFDVESALPPDEIGQGFDTLGDVLAMPDILLERYVDAAEQIAARAIFVADPQRPPVQRPSTEVITHSPNVNRRGDSWALSSVGFVGANFVVPVAGEYLLRARAYAQQAGDEPAKLEFRLAGREVARHDVLATKREPAEYQTRLKLEPGPLRVEAWFVNDYYKPEHPDKSQRDRNLYVEWFEFAGPIGAVLPTEFQRRALREGVDAHGAVAELARRAWRRPVSDEEVARLLALTPGDAARELRVRTALEALLCSPQFLFRFERDPAPGEVRDLDGFELATRLAYFLWSSTPDDALLAAAERGELASAEGRARQVRRMLRDARASELTRRFATQWLQLGQLEQLTPDPGRFPDFDAALRAAMLAETQLLFEAVLREERPLRELIDPAFTFLNARLARHYGLEGVRGEQLERVRLDDEQRTVRGGILQQASVLTVTSNPTRTSPVKRGKWVLEVLLGAPPLAPQPGVDTLDESPQASGAASLRERLARHREDAACAVCHDRMDPLGFALEHYDPVGRWREHDGAFAIDASGEFDDGERFDGAAPLEARVARSPAFVRGAFEKLTIYALGRGLRGADEPALEQAVEELSAEPTLVELIHAVVELDAFRRRAAPPR